MILSRLYVILDRETASAAGGDAIDAAEAAADAGARFFQIRDKRLSPDDLWRFAENVALRLAGFDPTIVINDRADMALALALAGVHRPQNGISIPALRRLMEYRLVGTSCHSLDEVEQANALHVDFLTISPVYPTTSKPKAKPLGLPALRKLTAAADAPVYALGGVASDDVRECVAHGAYGVAVLSGIMGADDPYAATTRYLSALGEN